MRTASSVAFQRDESGQLPSFAFFAKGAIRKKSGDPRRAGTGRVIGGVAQPSFSTVSLLELSGESVSSSSGRLVDLLSHEIAG